MLIHIPKTAGTSIKKALGLRTDIVDYRIPKDMVNNLLWEKYFVFCFVRNPFERLVSLYKYHTSDVYCWQNGVLYLENPNLQNMEFEDYFYTYRHSPELQAQINYIHHKYSPYPIDYIGRFEDLIEDFNVLIRSINVKAKLPTLAPNLHQAYRHYYTLRFKQEVANFYGEDLEYFKYTF